MRNYETAAHSMASRRYRLQQPGQWRRRLSSLLTGAARAGLVLASGTSATAVIGALFSIALGCLSLSPPSASARFLLTAYRHGYGYCRRQANHHQGSIAFRAST